MLTALPCLICSVEPTVLVVVTGALITIGLSMVTGLRIERFIERHVPWWPGDVGAAAGLIVGVTIVLGWVIPR